MIDEVREQTHDNVTRYLIRLGAAGETKVCGAEHDLELPRNAEVVVQTDRGLMLATVLQRRPVSTEPDAEAETLQAKVLKLATAEDMQKAGELERAANGEFTNWQKRIADWNVDVELIDLEWTLDGDRLLLYVLNERGPECTKLALLTAAAGLGIVEVIPVNTNGIAPPEKKSGCGSGGCGK